MNTGRLEQLLGERLLRSENLAKYTAARLGGDADFLYIARSTEAELLDVIQAAWADEIPLRIIGGGANVLVADEGIQGLVIVNRISEIMFQGRQVKVSSGTALSTLARRCQSQGLSGFEWAISVPGTVGGAVVNNAGAHGGDMVGNLVTTNILDHAHGLQTYTVEEMDYGYRSSVLKKRQNKQFFVVNAILELIPEDPQVIEEQMRSFIQYRKTTQPPGASLGSIFKNPEGDYAGRLIEMCDLKGHQIGGVQVSPIHANFFVHLGNSTAQDYVSLIQFVRTNVFKKTGIQLELEIELVGDWKNLKNGLS